MRQSSFACRVCLRRLRRRPTARVTAVDQVRCRAWPDGCRCYPCPCPVGVRVPCCPSGPGSRPGPSVGSCNVSVGSYLAHRGELPSSPWGVVAHARSTSESFAAPAGPARCPAPWTWTASESLGSADPCANLLTGPRLRLAAGRAGVPVLLTEAVPRDHNLPQSLSVWAILSLGLCLGPTVK